MSSPVPPPPAPAHVPVSHPAPHPGPYPPAGAPPVPPAWFVPAPAHPRATVAMVLGIVAVTGFLMVLVTVLVAPLAWYFGTVALRDIDRHPGRWTGRGAARAGQVLGAVGTALLVVTVMGTIVLATLTTVAASVPSPY